VIVKTSQLQNLALCWALSQTLGLGHTEEQILGGAFRPDTDLTDAKAVIDDCITEVHREEVGSWWAATATHSEVGETFLLAIGRAAVGERFGNELVIPDEFAPYVA
jgi:hypothetical protein